MSIDWRMKVYDETFTSRTQPGVANNIITSDMGVASLDTFDVDAAGGCLEASFRAVPSLVNIEPRDIIILEISTDSGSTWTPKYRGYVVTCGNPRSKSIQPYKLVGLKQRFYEKVVQLDVVDGDDVATMANDIFDDLVSESDLPSGVATTGEDIPILSFLQGNRYPGLETVGDALDALAETVGAFIVPTGSTYTYDGVTYSAGDTVPAIIWGVRPGGAFFFARPQAASVTISESDVQTFVLYNEITAEQVVDAVYLLYANDMNGTAIGDPVFLASGLVRGPVDQTNTIPLSHYFEFGGDKSAIVKPVDDPLSIMVDTADTAEGQGSPPPTNPGNAIDGNDTTYTEITSSGTLAIKVDGLTDVAGGYIARVRMESLAANTIVDIQAGSLTFGPIWLWQYEFEDSNQVFDILLPVLQNPLNSRQMMSFRISRVGAGNLRVYTVEILVPDVLEGGTLSEEYANGFVRQPTLDVATIRQVGSLGDVTQTIDFTPDGESTRDVPVERISYALTTNDGLTTTYHLGQAYDAELLSERAVLEALAKRATR